MRLILLEKLILQKDDFVCHYIYLCFHLKKLKRRIEIHHLMDYKTRL